MRFGDDSVKPTAKIEEQPAAAPKYGSEKEVADVLRLSRSSLFRLRRRGAGPPYAVVGGRILYRWSDVEAWFEANKPASRWRKLRITS